MMNTIRNWRRKAIVATLAAAVLPAAMIAGSGTAAADTQVWFQPGVSIGLPTTTTVDVHVTDKSGIQNQTGLIPGQKTCDYQATPVAGIDADLHFPPADQKFDLKPFGTTSFTFDVLPSGTVWHVSINCGPGYYTNVYDNPSFIF